VAGVRVGEGRVRVGDDALDLETGVAQPLLDELLRRSLVTQRARAPDELARQLDELVAPLLDRVAHRLLDPGRKRPRAAPVGHAASSHGPTSSTPSYTRPSGVSASSGPSSAWISARTGLSSQPRYASGESQSAVTSASSAPSTGRWSCARRKPGC